VSELEARQAADEALLWAVIGDWVKARYEAARVRARDAMAEARSEKQRVLDTDGADLGTVSMGERKWRAEVTDPDALLRWVKRNRPDELEQIVRASYIEALRKCAVLNAEQHGEPFPTDPQTGAVIPGIEATHSGGGLLISRSRQAKERMAALLGDLFEPLGPADARALEGAQEGDHHVD